MREHGLSRRREVWSWAGISHVPPGIGRFDRQGGAPYEPATLANPRSLRAVMKVRNSLKSLRGRHRDNKIVRRKGRVYVINKTQPRFKARQG